MSEQKLAETSAERAVLPRQPEVNIGTAGHVDHGKCVRWDQCVILDGVPMNGGEIMEMVRRTGRLLTRIDGGELFEFDQNEVVSIDRNFEPVKAASLFYVQDYHGQILTVRTRSGRSISVTPDHPLLGNSGGRIVWTRAKALKVGDNLAFLSQVPLSESLSFPDPLPRLRETYQIVTAADSEHIERISDGFRNLSALDMASFDKLRILCGLSASKISALAKMDLRTWRQLVSGKRLLKEPYRGRLTRVLSGVRYEPLHSGEFAVIPLGGKGRKIRKIRDLELDSDLAKWFAFVWSEGSSGRAFVDVTQTVQMKMLKEFLGITERKLGQSYRAYGGGKYKIYGKAFVDYIRYKFAFTPGNKYESPIAPWVCRLPRSLKATFLRWFLTLDGEFHNGQIALTQANDRNIIVVSYLLHSFGIVPRFSKVTHRVKAGTREYSRVIVSGRRNLKLFAENIGFENEQLQSKLLSYLREIKKASKETDLSVQIDAQALRSLLREMGLLRENFGNQENLPAMKLMSWYKAYEGAVRTGRISRTKLLLVIESIQDHLDRIDNSLADLSRRQRGVRSHFSLIGIAQTTAANELGIGRKRLLRALTRGSKTERDRIIDFAQKKTLQVLQRVRPQVDQLRLLASTPLEFDRIVSIDSERYNGRIYDLTVPEYHNFIAGRGAIVAHNSTLIQAITGVWTSAHSEELKRGITIKVGYADAAFYRCPHTPAPAAYSTSPKCPVCGRETKLLRAVSFVDSPGHESLMTNMLAGAFLMDGALFVVAANEPVPKPQTREHLQALQMLGMKNIVIAQNKIDLVTDAEAKKNHDQIQKFVDATVAADAPIVPISAQQKLNIDALIEAVEDIIPTPKRDPRADPLMYVVRSFDVNRPGAEIRELSGGVLGGSLTRGELRVGDEVELKPGMLDERSKKYIPIVTRISALQTGAGPTERVGPGGLVAVGTHLDPTFTKGDQIVGGMIGKPGTLPETLEHVTLEVVLLESVVGLAEAVKVDKVRLGETLRLNLGTASTLAAVTSARGETIEADLRKPVAVEVEMRAALSRRIAERWRLIGSGVLK